jgi:hypothetical protein
LAIQEGITNAIKSVQKRSFGGTKGNVPHYRAGGQPTDKTIWLGKLL